MANFVITGTSGVGKTHLERELTINHDFYQLPKLTDRPARDEEKNTSSLISLSRDQFTQYEIEDQFFFRLDYRDNRYGWRKSDLSANRDKNITLAITMESLPDFLLQNSSFIPVLLTVDPQNIDLISNRMLNRFDLTTKTLQQKMQINEDVEKRLQLAMQELSQIDKYIRIVEKYNGHTFIIKDDTTLYQVVIPKILQIANVQP